MDEAMRTVAERLAEQFAHLPLTTIVRVVTDCVAGRPQARPSEIEQAAEVTLSQVVAGRSQPVSEDE